MTEVDKRALAERKIVVTAIAADPFIIWKSLSDVGDIKKVLLKRRPGEDIVIADEDIEFTVIPGAYEEVLKLLKAGWKMDPFFHAGGRPWTVDVGHVWVLVKGSPEEIAELNPYVELPKPELTEADQRTIDKFEGIVDVIDMEPESLEDGRVAELTKKGYEVFNILKGHVVLVKREIDKSPSPIVEEAVTHARAKCPDCKGTGSIEEKASPPYEDEGPIIHTCDRCRGKGYLGYKHSMCYLGVARESILPQPKCDGRLEPNINCSDWDVSKNTCTWPGWEETA